MGIDVSVVDPRQVKYHRITKSIKPGTAARDREEDKVKKYSADYVNQNCQFEPFVLESFGRFGNRTRSLFNQVVERVLASKNAQSSPFMKNNWRMRVVMALHISASNGVKERMDEVLLGRKEECSLGKAPKERVDYDALARARY